jgi:hypothetical protein
MAAVGYSGKVQVGSTVWPLRSTTLYEETRPIIGDDIITGNASPIVFAEGELVYEGSLSFPMFDAMWTELMNFAVSARETSKNVIIDNGFDIFNYPAASGTCLCRSLNISSSPGGLIDCTLDVKSTGRVSTTRPAGSISATSSGNVNTHPYPWWKSALTSGSSTALGASASAAAADLSAWNVSINNNTIADLIADGSTRYAKIIQGQLTASGSITIINPAPISNLANGGTLRIAIGSHYLHFPNVVWTRYGVPLPGPNQRIKQTLDFTSLGDGTNLAVVPG